MKTPTPDQLLAALKRAGFTHYSDGLYARMSWPRVTGSRLLRPSIIVPLKPDNDNYADLVQGLLATLKEVADAGVCAASALEALEDDR